jgi:hypothetical protein
MQARAFARKELDYLQLRYKQQGAQRQTTIGSMLGGRATQSSIWSWDSFPKFELRTITASFIQDVYVAQGEKRGELQVQMLKSYLLTLFAYRFGSGNYCPGPNSSQRCSGYFACFPLAARYALATAYFECLHARTWLDRSDLSFLPTMHPTWSVACVCCMMA